MLKLCPPQCVASGLSTGTSSIPVLNPLKKWCPSRGGRETLRFRDEKRGIALFSGGLPKSVLPYDQPWFVTTWNTSVEFPKNEEKPIFIVVYVSWCEDVSLLGASMGEVQAGRGKAEKLRQPWSSPFPNSPPWPNSSCIWAWNKV